MAKIMIQELIIDTVMIQSLMMTMIAGRWMPSGGQLEESKLNGF